MVTLFRRTGPAAVLVLVLVTTVGCDRVTKKMAVQRLAGAPERTFLAGTVRATHQEPHTSR